MSDVKGKVLPIYFVADESGSMSDVIGELDKGLVELHEKLNLESLTASKVRLAVFGFSDEPVKHLDMSDLREVPSMPSFKARGGTAYGNIFTELKTQIPNDVSALKADGYQVHRPAVFFLTDGQPTDRGKWEEPLNELTSKDFSAHPNIVAFGIGQAEAETILRVATKDEFAFVAAEGTDAGTAIVEFSQKLTESIVYSGQALAEGRDELVVQKPESFKMAIDLV